MSSLPRLLKSGSDFEAKLLRAAKSERPSPAGMKRAVAAASTVALGTCAGVAAKSGLITVTKTPAWLVAIGASVGIAGVGVAVLASSSAGPPPLERTSGGAPTSSVLSASQPMASVASVTPVVPAATIGAEQPSDAPRVAPTAKAPPKPIRQATVSPSAPAPAAPVEDELTLLRRAKARIAANDAEGALEILDAHTKSYPRSMFGEEAETLRVEAFVATGDGLHAQRAADAFLERHPDSPYAQRVRSAITRIPR